MLKRLFLGFVLSAVGATAAYAHGDTGTVNGECRMMISNKYKMLFNGYQNQEKPFCDDIPEIGRTTIALDAGTDDPNSGELRKMKIDMRILRNVGQKDPGENEAANTLVYQPPKEIGGGTYFFEHDFKEKGDFIGVVKAYAPDGQVYRAVFPFAVGVSFERQMMAAGVAAVVALVGGYLFNRNVASKKPAT